MKWLVLLLLFVPLNVGAQSVSDFPRITGVSAVTVVGPFIFFDLDPVIPQTPFREWWAEMEVCTGIQKPFDDIQWFVADAIYNIVRLAEAWGIYYFSPPEIVVVRNMTLEQIEQTVKHEALHHLLALRGHDNDTFARCLP